MPSRTRKHMAHVLVVCIPKRPRKLFALFASELVCLMSKRDSSFLLRWTSRVAADKRKLTPAMNPRRDTAPKLQESEKRLLERFGPTAHSTYSGLHIPHGTKARIGRIWA